MATYTHSIVAGGNTYQLQKTVSAQHLIRFVDAYRSVYDTEENRIKYNGEVTEENPDNSLTDAQVVDAYFNGILQGTKAFIKQFEMSEARKTADENVTDIDFS